MTTETITTWPTPAALDRARSALDTFISTAAEAAEGDVLR
jgi:hypothetical protein